MFAGKVEKSHLGRGLEMKIFEFSPALKITLNFCLWPLIHLLAGYVAARRERASFKPEKSIYRLRKFEISGKVYEFLGVRFWKKYLPDFGNFFKKGFYKKKLKTKEIEYLKTFYVETCRAEFAHWLTMAGAPVFLLWNEWWGELIMLGYALLVNLPCIITQRYNRARLKRILEM